MPRARRPRSAAGKSVETLRHEEDTRTNIPTAEYQSMVKEEQEIPLRAETDEDACATLRSPRSRSFPKLESCCITVKVIYHWGTR